MRQFKLSEIVETLEKGLLTEGAIFISDTTGSQIIYDGDSLRWITANNYVSSIVKITDETAKDTFTLLKGSEKRLTFLEALPLIAEGTAVTIDMVHEKYTVESLSELEDVIELHEFLAALYEADCYIYSFGMPVEEKPVEVVNVFRERPNTATIRMLTEGDVYNIHHQYHFAKKAVKDIAADKAVTERMVYYILEGKRWADVHKQFHSDYCIVKDDYNS